MRASTVSRPVRHHVRETGAWVLRVSALAVASVLGWFTIYVSVTQLSAVPSDGSDSAILNLPYLLPVGLVIAALCLPTVRSLPVLLGSLRTSTVAWLISTASGVIEAYSRAILKDSSPRTAEMVVANVSRGLR